MILLMDAEHLKLVADAAEAAYPAEACGLLVGKGKGQLVRVTRVVPAANLEAGTCDRFELDPAARIAVEKELRDTGGAERVIGHYHSHTDGTAEPSTADRDAAHEPELAWLIVGVAEGQAIQTLAHRLDPKRNAFRHVPIRMRKKALASGSEIGHKAASRLDVPIV